MKSHSKNLVVLAVILGYFIGSYLFNSVQPPRKLQNIQDQPNKGRNQLNITSPECAYSHSIRQEHQPFLFPTTENKKRILGSKSCEWNFTGTHNCLLKVSCSIFELGGGSCTSRSMLITDSYKLKKTFCGTSSHPPNITASNSSRDLNVLLRGTFNSQLKLKCKVECMPKRSARQLPPIKIPPDQICLCGRKPTGEGIVNGAAAKRSEFPWLVAVVKENTRQPFCGASVINDRFILTAAHCVQDKHKDFLRFQLLLNAETLDVTPNAYKTLKQPEPKTYTSDVLYALDRGNNSVRLNVEKIFVHHLYIAQSNDFDVALVKTKERINITVKSQTPVCLPSLGSNLTYANQQATMTGWGFLSDDAPGTSLQLKKLNLTVFSNEICRHYYSDRFKSCMLCAGPKNGGMDTCQGDSGGPLVVESSPMMWTQVGSLAFGNDCAIPADPGVYIRTTDESINFFAAT